VSPPSRPGWPRATPAGRSAGRRRRPWPPQTAPGSSGGSRGARLKAAELICNAPGFDFVHLANSLAVRVARLGDGERRFFANRGVNGTDGSLGTFLGELLGTGSRGLALVGDQAAVHDLPGLAAAAWRGLRGAICVMNNGGAGIFDLLACSRIDGYKRTVRNPPFVDFAGAASAFGLPYRRCTSAAALSQALDDAAAADAVTWSRPPSHPPSAASYPGSCAR
jgi:2-succinyl-5-enolpyruvyl-6-hydroxy-3-cyclohexene-1-carboxylate synthase